LQRIQSEKRFASCGISIHKIDVLCAKSITISMKATICMGHGEMHFDKQYDHTCRVLVESKALDTLGAGDSQSLLCILNYHIVAFIKNTGLKL
jgi:hypothetical protein